jgi:hypothetical protein
MVKRDAGRFSKQEIDNRLTAILRGAFAGQPTPLKDIPTRHGEQRAERKDQRRPKRRRQRKNRAA